MDFLDLLFPKKCLECGRFGKYICKFCLTKVALSYSLCSGCGLPTRNGLTHTFCKDKIPLKALISIWKYEGVIRRAILKIKFNFASDIAKGLALLTVKRLKTNQLTVSQLSNCLLVPIPLHRRRQNWRGFNQAAELGKIVALKMDCRFEPDLLKRVIDTKHQTRLNRLERSVNIKDAFEIVSHQSLTTDYRLLIILFDDVYTTGSTMKEAARVLKKGGFKNIWGLTIAA